MRFVYACISDQCMKPMNEVMQTRKYKKAADLAAKMRIEHLTIDICSSWNRKKPNLESILCEGGHTIVVTDVTALGKKDEISDVYRRIIDSGCDILICYYNAAGFFEADELSTVTLQFIKKPTDSLEDNLQTLSYLSPALYRSKSSRVLDPRIIEAYWQIEHGQLSITDAIKELNVSRSTFERRISEYIGADEWTIRYEHEIDSSDIAKHATKLGRISDEAKLFHAYLTENPDQEHNYPIVVLASFAGLYPDLWEQLCDANTSDPPPPNQQQLNQKYYVLAHHHYREVIRFRKYLVFDKYRKSKQ